MRRIIATLALTTAALGVAVAPAAAEDDNNWTQQVIDVGTGYLDSALALTPIGGGNTD